MPKKPASLFANTWVLLLKRNVNWATRHRKRKGRKSLWTMGLHRLMTRILLQKKETKRHLRVVICALRLCLLKLLMVIVSYKLVTLNGVQLLLLFTLYLIIFALPNLIPILRTGRVSLAKETKRTLRALRDVRHLWARKHRRKLTHPLEAKKRVARQCVRSQITLIVRPRIS